MNLFKKSVPHNSGRRTSRLGLTLIEIMIALTMTLIVLYAMITAFQYASSEIASGRASIELSNQMRSAVELLRSDMRGLTVSPTPHSESTVPNGYFEYVEGPRRDYGGLSAQQGSATPFNYLGDVDDILAYTTRSTREPFRGRTPNGLLESNIAEVVWWTSFADRDNDGVVAFTENITLYRRVLLIRPDIALPAIPLLGDGTEDLQTAAAFLATNDISARWVDTSSPPDGLRDQMIANTISDLARRENRFVHDSASGSFPHQLVRFGTDSFNREIPSLINTVMSAGDGSGALVATGDDIMLTNLIGFDVKVYSRDATVEFPNADVNIPASRLESRIATEPNDIGYIGVDLNNTNIDPLRANLGSFVDLGFLTDSFVDNNAIEFDVAGTQFESYPTTQSQLRYQFDRTEDPLNVTFGYDVAYCTWWPFYERDGVDQDNDGLVDQGTNGLDDDTFNGVDDTNERETLPPYPYAPRGVEVTLRLIEKNSRQVRQQTVVHSFVAE